MRNTLSRRTAAQTATVREGEAGSPGNGPEELPALLQSVAACRLCENGLPHPPRPVLVVSATARLLIVGQAPGRRVHESGIPWNDPSGDLLRQWLGMSTGDFYDSRQVAIMPMGFCYPGKGASGDLPPRRECAPNWHPRLLAMMPRVELTLLIGWYAQRAWLGTRAGPDLTQTVRNYRQYLPDVFVLPHPSPRNRGWFARHPWFADEILPALRERLKALR